MVAAVVFDLDGVLVDSEELWARARYELVLAAGGTWNDDATRVMQGMSSVEWSRYLHDELRVPLAPDEISSAVVARMEQLYRERLPLLPGAAEAVASLSSRWPLGLASSANREIIDLVLGLGGLGRFFRATVSSEEVARGKPAPDVYLEAARRLGAAPPRCAAVEDSSNGLRAAAAAGMRVIALPNRAFPPDADALRCAQVVIHSLDDVRPELVARLG